MWKTAYQKRNITTACWCISVLHMGGAKRVWSEIAGASHLSEYLDTSKKENEKEKEKKDSIDWMINWWPSVTITFNNY